MIVDKTYKRTVNRPTRLFHIHSCALTNTSYFLCLLSSSILSSLAPSAQEDFVSLAEMEDSLLRNLFRGYQKWVRPVQHANDTITVRFGLKISQLVDVVRKKTRHNICEMYPNEHRHGRCSTEFDRNASISLVCGWRAYSAFLVTFTEGERLKGNRYNQSGL